MTIKDALKALYVALGGTATDVDDINSIAQLIDAIATLKSGSNN